MNTWQQYERENKRKSAFITFGITGSIITLMFLFGFTPPYPPFEAEGLTIDFGYGDTGFGLEEPSKSETKKTVAKENPEIKSITQDIEESVSVPDKKVEIKKVNKTDVVKPVIKKEELFDPSKLENNKSKSTSEGNNTKGGNQGSLDGVTNGNHGPGAGRGDDGSVGWSLDGRSMIAKPQLSIEHQEVGDLVIKIYVNRDGRVFKAEYERTGSQITNPAYIDVAKKEAMKTKFNADPQAQETQIGYVTFHFKLR